MKEFPAAINNPALDSAARLEALRLWAAKNRDISSVSQGDGEVNNHIHTVYSFSPYTPSMAALLAREAGLCAAGSVDHDSIAAAQEMIEACAILGIGGCVGFELRVGLQSGADGRPLPFAGRKINNPDSEGIAYMTVQGIPKPSVKAAAEFLAPLRARRLERTKAMIIAANAILQEAGIGEIDFERDIFAESKYAQGGEITERHLLAAAARKCMQQFGKGRELAEGLRSRLGIAVPPKIAALLADAANPHYLFDLLGILKSEFLPGIFIQPDGEECIPAYRVTAFADSIDAVPAYAYLGDVGESPTGDKKAEKFEDDFMEELFAELSSLGFRAITYMPPRNTLAQLAALRRLCAQWGFMEISGVDINSSRQSFNCPEVLREEFRHLLDTTWALIAHERLASLDRRLALFSPDNPLAGADISKRTSIYAAAGKRLDLFYPEESAAAIAEAMFKGDFV